MPIVPKPIGGADFESILAEVRARIPVHTPEWTHLEDSDPGITLVQLFAFMSESMLYRANRIPERNRTKFLQLLSLPLRPAEPATGFVVFDGTKGPATATPIPAGLTVSAGNVPFRTTEDVTAMPIEARLMVKTGTTLSTEELEDYQAAYTGFREDELTQLRFYETRPFPMPEKGLPLPRFDVRGQTIDGSVWIALVAPKEITVEDARQAVGGKTLSVGFLPIEDESRVISPFVEKGSSRPSMTWEISTDEADTTGATPVPSFKPLEARASGDVLGAAGIVRIELPRADELRTWTFLEPIEEGAGDFPPRLEEEDLGPRVIAWIRVRFRDEADAAFHWMGVHAAPIRQGVEVRNELLGKGTGEPDQSLTVANLPVLHDSLVLTVEDGEGGWEEWKEADDFLAQGRDDPAYTLDPESGEIVFGDGIHGRRPATGRRIRATYEYGGGTRGNVGIDSVKKATGLPAGIKPSNPFPTFGGADKETVAEGEERIPQHIRHRERVVTREDFEDIVGRTPGVRLGRLDVLPAFHPDLGEGTPGVVTLFVLPERDPYHPAAPRPDAFLLERLCRWVEPRRLVTSEVHLVGPCYVPIWVSVGISVRAANRDVVVQTVRDALRTYLSPLEGGPEGEGWPLGRPVLAKDLEAHATRVPGVEFVTGLHLADDRGRGVDRVVLSGLELPELVHISVVEGEPVPIEEVVGDSPRPGVDELDSVVAVPVVPEAC